MIIAVTVVPNNRRDLFNNLINGYVSSVFFDRINEPHVIEN